MSFFSGDFSVLKELMLRDQLNVVLASRACALLGNLMKHRSDFSLVLKRHPSLVDSILRCLQNEDSNVRKVSEVDFNFTLCSVRNAVKSSENAMKCHLVNEI